jgi:hypothetical protein
MARIRLATVPTTTTPAAGEVSIYAKADDSLYLKDSSGTERMIIDSSCPGFEGYKVEYFTLTLGEIIAGEITLTDTPAFPGRTLLNVYGAAPSFYAIDFTVAANVLSWTGLGLDGLLEPGDVLQVIYVS